MPVGGIAAGIVNLLRDDEGGLPQLKKAQRLWKELQLPEFDVDPQLAPELQQVAEYSPEGYDAQVEQGVSLPETSEDMRDQQQRALAGWERISQEGLPLGERIAAENMQRAMGMANTRNQMSVLRNLAERGRLGGGTEVGARMMGNQQSADLARGFGNDLSQMAIQNRLQALGQTGELSTQMRGQDEAMSVEQARSQNRFNEWVSGLRTGAAQFGAGSRERAGFANVGTQQQIADQNVLNNYLNRIRNQEYPNQMAQQGYQNMVTKLTGRTSALQAQATGEYAADEAKRQAIQGIGQGVDTALLAGLNFGITSPGQGQQRDATSGRRY